MSKKKLDLTNVESYTRMNEGRHRVKIVSCEDKTTQAGDDMIAIAFESISGDDKGSRVYDNFVLTEKALWKLKQLLKALGVKCDGKIVLDTEKLVGKKCEAEIYHEEYNGQMRARVDEYLKISGSDDEAEPEDDEYEEEEPEEKPTPKKKPAKKQPEPEPEEEEDDWDEEEEEPEPPKKSKKPEPKPAKKTKKPEPEPEDDDDEDWEEA